MHTEWMQLEYCVELAFVCVCVCVCGVCMCACMCVCVCVCDVCACVCVQRIQATLFSEVYTIQDIWTRDDSL